LKSGKLIVFSAPSGSGKTTLVHHLLDQKLPLQFSVSATSRPPRGKEVEGKDYYFITPAEFQAQIKKDAFIEYEEVYKDTYYGTLKSEVARIWSQECHVVFDIDVQGGLAIKKQYPKQTLAIFVQPPSIAELEKRLRQRKTETEEALKQRLEKAAYELSFAPQFDRMVVNDELERAKKEILALVKDFIG